MMPPSFYWHDYETFGADPKRDRPAQFAGLRTDSDFNAIGEPLVLYCKPSDDYLPHPEACLLTGITPQRAEVKGLCEAQFAAAIHQQLAQPQTCALGYNTLRFDDEVTRHLFYRNFFDPYTREWQNGNSRWDLMDLARTAYGLRPEGMVWPRHEDGKPSFRLEDLTTANGIEHSGAHDALADVRATIALAKLLKSAQPKLFAFLFDNRGKQAVWDMLQLGRWTPLVHVSGMYPAAAGCLAVVLPLCKQPGNENGVLVYDLAVDPEPLLTLDAEAVRQRLFTAHAELPDGVVRIPLKTLHVNKCPVLAPLAVLRPQDIDRWHVDLSACKKNASKLAAAGGLAAKLETVFTKTYIEQDDPEQMLYGGGFFGFHDKRIMETIRTAAPGQLARLHPQFKDARLPEMFFRYRARNYPSTLSAEEQERWQLFCCERLTSEAGNGQLSWREYWQELQWMAGQAGHRADVLKALHDYAVQLQARLGCREMPNLAETVASNSSLV